MTSAHLCNTPFTQPISAVLLSVFGSTPQVQMSYANRPQSITLMSPDSFSVVRPPHNANGKGGAKQPAVALPPIKGPPIHDIHTILEFLTPFSLFFRL